MLLLKMHLTFHSREPLKMHKKVKKKMHFTFQLMVHLVQLTVQSSALSVLEGHFEMHVAINITWKRMGT